jgi:hypothetical protein
VSGQPSLFDEPAPTTSSPAPWTEGGRHGWGMTVIVDAAGNAVATVWTHARGDVPADKRGPKASDYKPSARGQANLALIMAAPRLRDALRDLVGLARMAGPKLSQYEAAIADAEAALTAAVPPGGGE